MFDLCLHEHEHEQVALPTVIGIFGGTFDPIHLGHLRVAFEATELLSLDRLYFVPNAQPVHRQSPQASVEERLAMVAAAIADIPSWQVSDCEAIRTDHSYTYDTLVHFRQQFGNEVVLWLLLGSDAYQRFHHWYRWQDILALCHLAVMTRAGEQVKGGCMQTQALLDADHKKGYNADAPRVGRVLPIGVTALDVSSSQVRDLLHHQRLPRFLLPDCVLDYIQNNDLYRSEL